MPALFMPEKPHVGGRTAGTGARAGALALVPSQEKRPGWPWSPPRRSDLSEEFQEERARWKGRVYAALRASKREGSLCTESANRDE